MRTDHPHAEEPLAVTSEKTVALPAPLGWRTGGLAVAASLAGNVIVWAVTSVAGADMMVRPTGAAEPMKVNVGWVVASTALPLLVATVLMVLLRHRGAATWRMLAWVGLCIGVLTIVMPLTATTTVDTRVALTSMHLITGLVWFTSVRHAAHANGQRP